jgi:hypothetical protein
VLDLITMTQTIANLTTQGAGAGPTLTSDQKALFQSMQAEPPMLLDTSQGGSGGYGQLNFLDNMGADSDVPLQFQSTPANCHVFYMAGDVLDVSSTWARIVNGNFTCVDGGNPAANPGGSAPKKAGGNVNASIKIAGAAFAAVFSVMFLIM